jgi:glycosyltransferase involved in cell wall biosynthesis
LSKLISVAIYKRKPRSGAHSVERMYADLIGANDNFHFSVNENKYHSNGLVKRLFDIVLAVFKQADINHIIGDVHYLSYFLKREKTILTVLDCYVLNFSKGLKQKIFLLFWYLIPMYRASTVITISNFSKQEIVKKTGYSKNIEVIYPCLSAEFIYHPKAFDEAMPRILHIGTAPNKNLARHIQALAQIPCTLVIIGTLATEELSLLQKFKIKYENYVNITPGDLFNEYVSADMLLFSSTYEGFGLPIIEAQAVGRVVVTANIASMPEVAADGAIFVDPYQVESIRSGILSAIHSTNMREDLITKGLKNSKRFSLSDFSSQHTTLYKNLLKL